MTAYIYRHFIPTTAFLVGFEIQKFISLSVGHNIYKSEDRTITIAFPAWPSLGLITMTM